MWLLLDITFKLKSLDVLKTKQPFNICWDPPGSALMQDVHGGNIAGPQKTDRTISIYHNDCTALRALALNCRVWPQSVIKVLAQEGRLQRRLEFVLNTKSETNQSGGSATIIHYTQRY